VLTEQQQTDLRTEIVKPDYDGLSAEDAHAKLFAERHTTTTRPSGLRLTPLTGAKLLGAKKAEAVVSAVKVAYPNTADFLLHDGLDPASDEVQAFITALAGAGVLTPADLAAVQAASVIVETVTRFPLAVERFQGVAGFPNHVDLDDFTEVFKTR
jgi:hypothetical protein